MSDRLTLEEWRRVRKVSQEKMADVCGIHVNTYRIWEKSPGEIRIDQAIKIADFLKISLDDIVLQANTMNNSTQENSAKSV